MTSPTPRVLAGRFQIKSPLGGGGFGDVYLALDLSLGRDVALKVFKPDVVREGDPVWLEAQAAAGVKSPFVATVYDIVMDGDLVFLVYEFVAGPALATVMRSRRLPLLECKRILRDVCRGVEDAHRAHILHRDLKPANIILTSDPIDQGLDVVAKVTDFGLAKQRDKATQLTARHLGSPAYMSPEQFQGRPSSPQTDIYALGVTAFEMLGGSLPFPSGDMAYRHVHEPPPALDSYSKQLSAVLQKAMAKGAEERFRSVDEFRLALEQTMEPSQKTGIPAPSSGPATATGASRAFLDGIAMKLREFPEIEGFPIDQKAQASDPSRKFGAVRVWSFDRRWSIRPTGPKRLVIAAVSLGGGEAFGSDGLPRADVLEQIEHHNNRIVSLDKDTQHRIGIYSPSGWPEPWTRFPLVNGRVRFYLVDQPDVKGAAWRVQCGAPDDPLRTRLFNPESHPAVTRRIREALEVERDLRSVGDIMPLARFAERNVTDPEIVILVISEWDGRFKVVSGTTLQRRKG